VCLSLLLFRVVPLVDSALHRRRGDVCRLAVGAIVIPTNDKMNDPHGLSGYVLDVSLLVLGLLMLIVCIVLVSHQNLPF